MPSTLLIGGRRIGTNRSRRVKRAAMLLAAAAGVWAVGAQGRAGTITSGNLVVERVGDNSAALSSASTALFLDQFTTSGTAITPSIAVPITGAAQLTDSGSATSEGQLTLSPNGLVLNVAGYNATTGVAGIVGTAGSLYSRAVNTVTADGTFARAGSTSTAFSTNNIRSGISSGSDVWAVGANTGTVYLPTGGTVSATVTNARVLGIAAGAGGGQLYLSTGSGSARGVYAVGTGLPTTGAVTATSVLNLGASASPYAFAFNTAMTVAYVADDSALTSGGGILKFTKSGSTWTKTTTFGTAVGLTAGLRGLAVDWSNPNAPVIYGTTAPSAANGSANQLIKLVDSGSPTATVLATAPTNESFRSVQLGVLPSVWTKQAANSSTTDWKDTSSPATELSSWSTIQAVDSNIAFQNVNGGSSPLNLRINNNSGLTSVSSINFQSGGYGGGSGNTLYTLVGNGVALSATASTSAAGVTGGYAVGVANNSGVGQAVNIHLSLNNDIAFNAATGALAFGGTIDVHGKALLVTGAGNTTLGAAVLDTAGRGSISKMGLGTLYVDSQEAAPVSVQAGTLGGNGAISGDLTIGTAGILAPGVNAISTLTTGNVTLAGISDFEISAAPGLAHDLLDASGHTIIYGGDLKIANVDGTLAIGQHWDLFHGTAVGTFDNIPSAGTAGGGMTLLPDLSGINGLWEFDSSTGKLSIVAAVPLPAAVWGGMAMLGAIGLVRRRFMKRV